ncbi:hypothetical protein AKJ09_01884 [Labilithrix luteola]|uniref:TonB C-terminal domain-containing protein n=1 Tax=Labilithrix luteola TaxID=1391654 RepID=A0A0K1PNW3_9BACT|nr:hypothetical protein [Labilithrix luteola]AKU95220.1 hypothetical protein AKJ09_01884 [Labilithrix luteola]
MATSIQYPFEQVQRHMPGTPGTPGAPLPAAPSSGSPFTIDPNDNSVDFADVGLPWNRRLPPRWLALTGYLLVGVAIGLVLLLGMALSRRERLAHAAGAATGVAATAATISDAVVHLHAAHIDKTCWQGIAPQENPTRLTVSMAIGADGKIRSATSAGGSATMRSCVESYVKTWEFLPQTGTPSMIVPVEVAR